MTATRASSINSLENFKKVFPLEKFGDTRKSIVLLALAIIGFATAILLESGALSDVLGIGAINATPLPLILGSIFYVYALYSFTLR